MSEESKAKLLSVLPFLRDAMKTARKDGRPQIGILAVEPNGSGRVVCQFDADEFIEDICRVLGASTENTKDEDLDAKALQIVQMVERAGGIIVDEPVGLHG